MRNSTSPQLDQAPVRATVGIALIWPPRTPTSRSGRRGRQPPAPMRAAPLSDRQRPETAAPSLLVLRDGRPVRVETLTDLFLFRRTQSRLGFKIHAYRFRHTFATACLRRRGELERLRRILGHTSYVMVMRYVHLDKGDVFREFDLRSPF